MNDIKYNSLLQSQSINKLNSQIKNKQNNGNPGEISFNSLLKEKIESVQLSKHAMQRLNQRGINIDGNTLAKINDAIDKAHLKGVKDMVVLNENNAFIVNVPSKIVVTTMSMAEMKNNIFTNIDGAVII